MFVILKTTTLEIWLTALVPAGNILQRIKMDTGCRIWYQRTMRRKDNSSEMVQNIYLDGSDLAVAAAACAIENIARGRTPDRIPFSSMTLSNTAFYRAVKLWYRVNSRRPVLLLFVLRYLIPQFAGATLNVLYTLLT